MKLINEMKLEFESKTVNEGFARSAVAAFILQTDPTIAELSDIKTAVSEAVTNCIIHGYKLHNGKIYINVSVYDNEKIVIKVKDKGCGIENVKQAMEPLYTTGGSENAGLGFAVMETFMDKIKVNSAVGKGTTVIMEKRIIRCGGKLNEQ